MTPPPAAGTPVPPPLLDGSAGEAADPVTALLARTHREVAAIEDGGAVATYIPVLAEADPQTFGLALASTGGRVYRYGDTDVPFSIQSVSKPFVYALVLAELGEGAVDSRIATEPSGEAFNAVSLDPGTGRPANAMVNAGAIVASSLVRAGSPAERVRRIVESLSRFAGASLEVDARVLDSERRSGDRNRALAYLAASSGALAGDPVDAVEVYFAQCAVRVTAVDIAVMAATLAAGGVNPRTGRRVVERAVAERVLAVMATCGMYDAAGDWMVHVGLPAKSGVSGGLIAVSPSQFGMGILSPPLDPAGNPVRGVSTLRLLSRRFRLSALHDAGRAAPTVRLRTDAAARPSRRSRTVTDSVLLQPQAARIRIVAAQGQVEFAAAERIVDACLETAPTGPEPPPGWLVLDLTAVTGVDPAAGAMLGSLEHLLTTHGLTTRLVLSDEVAAAAGPGGAPELASAARSKTLDEAIAWCEDDLLASLH